MDKRAYRLEADSIIESQIAQLRALTFAKAAVLPEIVIEEEVVIQNRKCTLTVFAQHSPYALPGVTLVTVQIALPGFLGIASYHRERGLVFSPGESIRDANEEELQNSGG